MGTRYVHQVRCKKQDNTQSPPVPDDTTFVDVEITDAISFIGPNGQQMIIDFSKLANQNPYIIDEVGAGVGTGSPDNATRTSHMELITNPDDSSEQLYIEVLDICSFISPNGNKGILDFSSARAGYAVDDQANLGIGDTSNPNGDQTRRGHTMKIQSKVTPDDTQYIGVLTTDAWSIITVNGEQVILDVSTYDVEDTTQYTTDSNGNNVPPDNTDPNTYVKFPDASTGPWIKIGDGSNPMGPIGAAQGPLWRIVNADSNAGPWWVYTPTYQPTEYTFIAFEGCIGGAHWDVRCFPYCAPYECGCEPEWTDYYPPASCSYFVIWPCIGSFIWVGCGGSVPSPQAPMAQQGYSSDNQAAQAAQATGGLYGCSKINWTTPPQERFLQLTLQLGGWEPNIWQIVGPGDTSGGAAPIVQPSHIDPGTGNIVYDQPSAGLAKKVAQLYMSQWNATSAAYNAGEAAVSGACAPAQLCQYLAGPPGSPAPNCSGGTSPYAGGTNAQYPSEVADWNFGIAIIDGQSDPVNGESSIGPSYAQGPGVSLGNPYYPRNQFDFCGGLPPAGWWGGHSIDCCGDHGYTVWIFHPSGPATMLKAVQLDPKVWDTSGDVPKLKPPPPDNGDNPWPPA